MESSRDLLDNRVRHTDLHDGEHIAGSPCELTRAGSSSYRPLGVTYGRPRAEGNASMPPALFPFVCPYNVRFWREADIGPTGSNDRF